MVLGDAKGIRCGQHGKLVFAVMELVAWVIESGFQVAFIADTSRPAKDDELFGMHADRRRERHFWGGKPQRNFKRWERSRSIKLCGRRISSMA